MGTAFVLISLISHTRAMCSRDGVLELTPALLRVGLALQYRPDRHTTLTIKHMECAQKMQLQVKVFTILKKLSLDCILVVRRVRK
jgi:hypothetical protein